MSAKAEIGDTVRLFNRYQPWGHNGHVGKVIRIERRRGSERYVYHRHEFVQGYVRIYIIECECGTTVRSVAQFIRRVE